MIAKALLYARTIIRMTPRMVASRIKGVKKVAPVVSTPELQSVDVLIPETDLGETYLSRFDVEALLNDEVSLLNERHHLDTSVWAVSSASHLWNFNLHYFEYCIPLAAAWSRTRDVRYWNCFKRLVESWIEICRYAEGDAWHPYTISLRLVNWLVCRSLFSEMLAGDEAFDSVMRCSMYLQYRHLLANQETHLLANHYLENLKTLLIMAKAFGARDAFLKVGRSFVDQLDEQILPDGIHFERSMMYHKLILEGLIRVRMVCGPDEVELRHILDMKMRAMVDAMESIEKGLGKTPFFNDSADGVAKDHAALAVVCERITGVKANDTLVAFPDAGFYKLYSDDLAVVVFAGPPGPRYMLGHAHCDVLSFELSCRGKPVLANSGTYAYQDKRRSLLRSTRAHNTAWVNGEEQMECWGEHRVARGVTAVRVESFSPSEICASCRNFHGRTQRRVLRLAHAKLVVEDSFSGTPGHVESFAHVVPGMGLEMRGNQVRSKKGLSMAPLGVGIDLSMENCVYSSEFGVLDGSASLATFSISDGTSISYEIDFEINNQKEL